MSNEQNNQSKCDCSSGSSNKLMLLVGVLLGVAIISTVAFFVVLSKGAGESKTGADEGVNVKKEEQAVKQKEQAVKQEDAQAVNEQQPPAQPAKQVDLSKLAITADDHIKGKSDAPVTIVIYDDMECPFCGAFEGTNADVADMLKQRSPGWTPVMPSLIKDYIDTGKVKLVYRHFPLSFHQNALPAAEASECAGAQGKFWEMHDKIFAINGQALGSEVFKQMARDLKLDVDKYNACMDNHQMQARVANDMQTGQALGVEGTPAAFINQQGISGAVPFSDFKSVINEELGGK